MGCKERDKASTRTTNKLCVKKKGRRKKKKAIKEMCADVISSKASKSEQANCIKKITWISLGFVLS